MGDTNSNDTCQNHERFRIIRNVRIDIHQRLKIKQAASIWTITTRTFPQQNHFRNKSIFTARPFSQQSTRPLSQQDHIHSKTKFTTRKHETRTAVAVLPVGVSAVGTPGTSGNVRSVTASLIGPHPAALCARIAYLESQRNQKNSVGIDRPCK